MRSSRLQRSPLYGIAVRTVDDLPVMKARIAFRDVTSPTNRRSVIACLIPPGSPVVDKSPYLLRLDGHESDEAYVLGVMSSIPFDWYARRWVELKLSYQLLNPMPVPRPNPTSSLRKRVVELAGRLAAVDDRYQEWADEVGVPVGTLRNEPERSDAIAELDALVGLLYGLSEDRLLHIFETFHRGWDYTERWAAVRQHYRAWEAKT